MEHVTSVDPEKQWPRIYGYWFRVRGLITVAGLDGFALSWAWKTPYAYAVFFSGVVLIGSLYVLRLWHRRQLEGDIAFHTLCHHLRDEISLSNEDADNPCGSPKGLRHFSDSTAQRIAFVFGRLKNDNSVGCCIRLAQSTKKTEEVYATVGRSYNFDPSRDVNSFPFSANEGTAKFLRDKDTQGVLIVRDIMEAVKDGIWVRTQNDNLPDIRTLMVAPINGYSGNKKCMLGILYVTSKYDRFQASDTLLVKSTADILGSAYSQLVAKLSEKNRTKNVPR